MIQSVKQQLHQLVGKCDDELLLNEARALLASGGKDWWDDLDEEDKNLLMESEAQYERGDFITHKELMQQFEEWKKK